MRMSKPKGFKKIAGTSMAMDHGYLTLPTVKVGALMEGFMEETKPKVRLIGEDGNAFAIMRACQRAARKAGWSQEKIKSVRDDMTSGDYTHLLSVAMREFDVE